MKMENYREELKGGRGMLKMNEKKILDVTCACRSIWFNKNHPNAIYCDIREGDFEKNFGKGHGGVKKIHVHPDIVADFTDLPFKDSSFSLVVFDPPHFTRLKDSSWVKVAYGNLEKTNWKQVIRDGVKECFRVLKPDGVLVFKWADVQYKTSEVIEAIGVEPLFGHRSGKKSNTHWMVFMKGV